MINHDVTLSFPLMSTVLIFISISGVYNYALLVLLNHIFVKIFEDIIVISV
jgi:hypothetical protein